MKFRLHNSLKVARAVVDAVQVPTTIAGMGSVVGYENGREHGLCIQLFLPDAQVLNVCVAENRNSDDIVVYLGEVNERFQGDTNVPTQRAYKSAKYFHPGEHVKAAQHIAHYLRSTVAVVLDAIRREVAAK